MRHLSYSFILLVHSFMHPALVESQSLLWQDCSWCRRIFSHSRRDSELDHTTSWHRLWIIYHFSHGLLLEPLGFMASERHQTGFSPTENLQISSQGFVVDTLSLSGLLSSIVESPPDETCQDEKTDVGFSLCGLSCRDLMQILIVCNIIDVCCPVFLGHHHNYTF